MTPALPPGRPRPAPPTTASRNATCHSSRAERRGSVLGSRIISLKFHVLRGVKIC